MKKRIISIVAISLGFINACMAVGNYTITDLGIGMAYAVNDYGHVVGVSEGDAWQNQGYAFLFDASAKSWLRLLY